MAAVNSVYDGCEPKPPDRCESSFTDTGHTVPIRTQTKGFSVQDTPSSQTIKEKLDSMPMEEFVVLLEGCADKSKVKTSEQAEIISQLEYQMKIQPEEAIPSLTNAKHSSSLQSLLHKDKGKSHHKVATSTGINNRPGDLYQQQSQNVTNCSATTTVSPSVVVPVSSPAVAPNLPAQYYFNCAAQDVCQPPSNLNNRESQSILPAPTITEVRSSSPPVVLNPNQTSTLVTPQTIVAHAGLTPHHQPGQILTGTAASYTSSNSSQGKATSDHRKPIIKKGKGNKGLRETKLITDNIPGFRGNGDVDELVQFVEGTPAGKRGNKKKERENRGKTYGNDTLVKSMSLDDDNLSFAAKKTGDRGDRAASLKDTAGVRSDRSRIEKDKKDKDFGKAVSSPGIKKSLANQGNRRESDQEDNKSPLRDQAEPKFTVVIRKRKTKTACITSPTGSTTGKEVDKRKDSWRSRSRGDRRKSVGSVPSSDQSEGSDDGSVRSLPAGECTKREDVPKSCASSGGTPQTSYADIARLTKDEENKKELPQALEDYPSLHASDNSEASDDGSDSFVPIDDSTPKDIGVKSISSGGGTPLTSYADIARLASHEEKKDDKKDHPSEDFPELSTTIGVASQESPNELLPSPKSDSNAPVTKYGSNDSAFPQLTSGSASKTSCTQGPLNQKTMSSVISSNPATGTSKVSNSLPVSASSNYVARAPTPTSKAQLNPASLASMGSSVPPSAKNYVNNVVSVAGNAGCVSKPASHVEPVRVLNSPTNVSLNSAPDVDYSRASFKSQVYQNGKSKPKDVTTVIVNGHLSDSEKDKPILRSDITGAKVENSTFSVTAPQPYNVDSGLGGQSTEAVVFCGENFKEPPQFTSRSVEYQFGFDINETLVDMNKQTSDSPSGSTNGFNKKQSKVKHVPSPPPKEVQDGISQQPVNKHNAGVPDDSQTRVNQPALRGKNQLTSRNARNSVSTNQGRNNSPRNYDVANPDNKLQSGHQDRNQPNRGSQHRINPHNSKKPVQVLQPVLAEGVQPVANQMASAEGYKNPTVVTAYPLNVNPVHINSGIPPTVYELPGYVSGVPPSGPFQNRIQGISHLPAPGILPVQLPPVIFDSTPSQYASPVYRVPPAPVASVAGTEDPACITRSVSVQPQHPAPVSSEYISNTPGVVTIPGRQSHQVVPVPTGYYQVPDPHLSTSNESESGPIVGPALVPIDVSNVAGMYITSNMVFEYPVNFAQYYLPPDPSPYNNANVEDLRSYLERRSQECIRLQFEDTNRVRNIT